MLWVVVYEGFVTDHLEMLTRLVIADCAESAMGKFNDWRDERRGTHWTFDHMSYAKSATRAKVIE